MKNEKFFRALRIFLRIALIVAVPAFLIYITGSLMNGISNKPAIVMQDNVSEGIGLEDFNKDQIDEFRIELADKSYSELISLVGIDNLKKSSLYRDPVTALQYGFITSEEINNLTQIKVQECMNYRGFETYPSKIPKGEPLERVESLNYRKEYNFGFSKQSSQKLADAQNLVIEKMDEITKNLDPSVSKEYFLALNGNDASDGCYKEAEQSLYGKHPILRKDSKNRAIFAEIAERIDGHPEVISAKLSYKKCMLSKGHDIKSLSDAKSMAKNNFDKRLENADAINKKLAIADWECLSKTLWPVYDKYFYYE